MDGATFKYIWRRGGVVVDYLMLDVLKPERLHLLV